MSKNGVMYCVWSQSWTVEPNYYGSFWIDNNPWMNVNGIRLDRGSTDFATLEDALQFLQRAAGLPDKVGTTELHVDMTLTEERPPVIDENGDVHVQSREIYHLHDHVIQKL